MTIEFMIFGISVVGYVVLALVNVESLRAPASNRATSPRRPSSTPPSRD